MDNFIKWICLFLGIDATNEMVIIDIAEELERHNIQDVVKFKEFIKTNKSHIDLKYENGLGKLYKIIEMFTKHKHKHLLDGLDAKARDLKNKVQIAINQEGKEILLKPNFKWTWFENYFTNKELNILNQNKIKRIHFLCEDSFLLEKEFLRIYKAIAAKYIKNKTQTAPVALKHKENRKMIPLRDAIKRF